MILDFHDDKYVAFKNNYYYNVCSITDNFFKVLRYHYYSDSRQIDEVEKMAQDFQPTYIGGYPTEETAAAMFEEYDYQAATQFYIWAYAYLNGYGFDRGMAALGGDPMPKTMSWLRMASI